VHSPVTGEGDDLVPERIDGGGYGFGLFVTHDTRFGHFISHSGGLPGYGSNMRWLPGSGVGVIALANVTYAPMAMLARRLLEIIDDHVGIVDAPCRPSDALVDAAERLAALLSAWTDQAAESLFADNVAIDDPLARRAAAAADLVRDHGPLALTSVTAVTPMRGRATMRHSDGAELVLDLEMCPLLPPRLQLYEVVAG
jgi:Beta-lactamase